MGTNYYLRANECTHCNRYDELHIGKSSVGWTFSFQAHFAPSIRSWQDWKQEIQQGGRIFNEYGEEISLLQLEELINSKRDALHTRAREYPENSFLDDENNSFSEGHFS